MGLSLGGRLPDGSCIVVDDFALTSSTLLLILRAIKLPGSTEEPGEATVPQWQEALSDGLNSDRALTFVSWLGNRDTYTIVTECMRYARIVVHLREIVERLAAQSCVSVYWA